MTVVGTTLAKAAAMGITVAEATVVEATAIEATVAEAKVGAAMARQEAAVVRPRAVMV